MKPSVINTELRSIHLKYRLKKTLSEFEKEALKEYERLHNSLHHLVKRHTAMNGKMLKQEMELDDLLAEMQLLENKLKQAGPLAGYEIEDIAVPDGTEISIDVNEILTMANDHKFRMDIYHEALGLLEKELEKWNTDYDTFYDEEDVFSKKYINIIIHEWERMVIDSVAWDSDNQEFFGVMDDLTFKKKKYFTENWNLYIDKHNNYYHDLNELFIRVNTFSDKVVITNKGKLIQQGRQKW